MRIASSWPPKPEAVKPGFDRRAFFDKFEQVRDGMSKGLVRAMLGEPDDVLSEAEPGPYSEDMRVAERWCYGTNGHGSFATLGIVPFDRDGSVADFVLPLSNPPPQGWFKEGELRALLRTIDAACAGRGMFIGKAFDPLLTIRAVNALLPLGKEKALTVVREYVRVTGDRTGASSLGVIHLLHLLFEMDLPTPEIRKAYEDYWSGNGHPYASEVRTNSGVPFDWTTGRVFVGPLRFPVFECLEECSRFGRLRAGPLDPPDTPNPVVGEALSVMPEALIEPSRTALEASLKDQWIRLVRTVAEPSTLASPSLSGIADDATFERVLASLSGKAVRWDSSDGRYEFADGRVYSEPSTPKASGATWIPAELSPIAGRVLVRRTRDWYVSVLVRWEGPSPTDTPVVRVRVIPDKGDADDAIAEFELPERTSRSNLPEGSAGYRAMGGRYEMSESAMLARDLPIRIEVTVEGRKSSSPPIRV